MFFCVSQLSSFTEWGSELQVAFWLLLTLHWHETYMEMLSVHPT